ncbi:S8 family serine peptidase [Kribbella sp. GL6]|uniref:S8 family serine peptidase n=1 Tax=Kribbella sp. GL6 TaxID=3419765 RepID=UPI003CFC0329
MARTPTPPRSGQAWPRTAVAAGIAVTTATILVVGSISAAADATPTPTVSAQAPAAVVRTLPLGDGSTVTESADGIARHLAANGKVLATRSLPAAAHTALGTEAALTDTALRELFSVQSPASDPGSVIAVLGSPVSGRGARIQAGKPKLTAALRAVRAGKARAMFKGGRAAAVPSDSQLASAVVIDVPKGTSATAAAALRKAGASYAEPNAFVTGMSTGGEPLAAGTGLPATASTPATSAASAPGLPSNFGLTSSLQSFLNAGGVNAMGAYRLIKDRWGQLPGAGQTITNVSIGDLTDASMTDPYVKRYGPTTVVKDGQRYLDLPAMPLIPTYTSGPDGTLDPLGSTRNQDPGLGEVLLDFGVMAPLPHDQQRPEALGSGATDLLGIAPGADYRLVVPQTPTIDQVTVALLAAAQQTPRPTVITASLGFGTDSFGFPGRYLEDDPVIQSVVRTIVSKYNIVVCISSNDGTRLYTPAAIGPDGGSTPTDLASSAADATSIGDDQLSTTPSRVLDSGAIAVGGTTLDDTLTVSPRSAGPAAGVATYATTRFNGSGAFSSGFGQRINVSAPSDGIVVYSHQLGGDAHAVVPTLSGGTSASAPEVAAAAAVLLQTVKLAGQTMTAAQVRDRLIATGRPVATPEQNDRTLQVGNQLDLTAAVESVTPAGKPEIVRVSVAHRVANGKLGARFTEDTDQQLIDLSGAHPTGPALPGGGNGMGLIGPVTIAADVLGMSKRKNVTYRLTINGHDHVSSTPSIRLLPSVMLADAGLPVVATDNRTLDYTFTVLSGDKAVVSTTRSLTFGPTDGTFTEAPAPVIAPVVKAGHDVEVTYDLRGVRATALKDPALLVSHVGHWNPVLSPLFSPAYRVPLTTDHGVVTIPASAFTGGGVYGIGYAQQSTDGSPTSSDVYGDFASVRVDGAGIADRPQAPTLSATDTPAGHLLVATDAAPDFTVGYDVSTVAGATGAVVEIAAPAPNLFNSINTFINHNGTQRDADGVDTGSVVYQPVSGTTGTADLSVKTLKLVGSNLYSLRVLATGPNGKVLGQASASSMLVYQNGTAPDDSYVDAFAATGNGPSVVVTRDANWAMSLRSYQTNTGTYGPILATDTDPSHQYDVIGVDTDVDRAVVIGRSDNADTVQTYAPSAGTHLATIELPGRFVAGRIDHRRHRAALLLHAPNGADLVVSVDLTDGSIGQPIDADAGRSIAGQLQLLTVDESTGKAYASTVSGRLICFTGSGYLSTVDLDAATASVRSTPRCVSALTDNDNGTLGQLGYRSVSINFAGDATIQQTDLATSTAKPATAIRKQFPLAMAVDGPNNLAIVAFGSPVGRQHYGGNIQEDNNATSQLVVVDLTSGAAINTIGGFDFTNLHLLGTMSSLAGEGIQLDPTTRTGWTYAPDGGQIQTFHY